MPEEVILEIGTEELPARFIIPALKQLEEIVSSSLKEQRIGYEKALTWATPRRLTVYLQQVADKQEDVTLEIKGPPSSVAYDKSGVLTKAGLGFANSKGIKIDDLYAKDNYLYGKKTDYGKNSKEVLSQLMPKWIGSLTFPKSMRWEEEDFVFARPIHWLLALFGREVIPFRLAGIESGNQTWGHRFLSKGPFTLDHPVNYIKTLEDNCVIPLPNKRKKLINKQITHLANLKTGKVFTSISEENLLEEVNYLVEHPTSFCGYFDKKYLSLPSEILTTVMRGHQRYFPLWDDDGRLMPYFIAVANTGKEFIEQIRDGNERVLKARLADAEFFFKEDLKTPLPVKAKDLANLTFQKKLGTMGEKVKRLEELVAVMGTQLNLDNQHIHKAKQAANLCKADLVTNMVREFTELQGIIGREYAKMEGIDNEVAAAIFEHYLPRFLGDELPETLTGRLVNLADKIDNLAGCFGSGLLPSGSTDPYGLRRQGLGLVMIISQSGLKLNLEELFLKAFGLYVTASYIKQENVEKAFDLLKSFILQRVEHFLGTKDISNDLIKTTTGKGINYLSDAEKRAVFLTEKKKEEGFITLITAAVRVYNILKPIKPDDVFFKEEEIDEEFTKKLFASYKEAKEKIKDEDNYQQLWEQLNTLVEPINSFFDHVLVMCEDETLRRNRLGLLKEIKQLFWRFGDLSQIEVKLV